MITTIILSLGARLIIWYHIEIFNNLEHEDFKIFKMLHNHEEKTN